MIHGDMKRLPNGRKKSYDAWGKTSSKSSLEKELGTSQNTYQWTAQPRRHSNSESIKSVHTTTSGGCLKQKQKIYSGTLIKGISTMHKSNAVPVINTEEMKEHAKMRR